MSVLAIVLIAVYGLHAQTLRLAGAIEFDTVASLLAQQEIAAAETQPDDSHVSSVSVSDALTEYVRQTSVGAIKIPSPEVFHSDLKLLEVSIHQRNDQQHFRLQTLRFVPR